MQVQDKLGSKFKSSLIPNEYESLDYIQKDKFDNSYLDTGYIASSSTKVKIDFEVLEFHSSLRWVAVFGYYSNTIKDFFCSISSVSAGRSVNSRIGLTPLNSVEKALEHKRYLVTFDRFCINVNGTQEAFSEPAQIDKSEKLYLFSMNSSVSGFNLENSFRHRVYSCKFYENNSLTMDLLPAKRKSDSALGMFDLMSGKFLLVSEQSSFIGK